MKIVNSAVCGNAKQRDKMISKFKKNKDYKRVTSRKLKTKVSSKSYGPYYYVVNAWK
jgi:hypothetical protein